MAKKLLSCWLLLVLVLGVIAVLPTEIDARSSHRRSAAKRRGAVRHTGRASRTRRGKRTARRRGRRGSMRAGSRRSRVRHSRYTRIGGPASAMPPERVREIQAALKQEGYLQSEPTGQYDKATVEAMMSYQKAHNLRATGYPTAEALQNLGLTRSQRTVAPTEPGESKKDNGPQSQTMPQGPEHQN